VRTSILTLLLLFGFALGVSADTTMPSNHAVRILLVGDPFAQAMLATQDAFTAEHGLRLDIEVIGYTDAYDRILLNARDFTSSYDIVSVDVLWLTEFAEMGVLLPLDDRLATSDLIRPDEFLPIAYESATHNGVHYAFPIQPHPELLWYRADWFREAELAPPVTTADVLLAAETLHNPNEARYGICWNAQRRQALGQQMAHFYAAHGGRLLDADAQPQLDSDAGRAAANYALDLMAYSPPDILTMAWNQRIDRFRQGGCAMTYGWAARTYLLDGFLTSEQVGYAPAPHAPDAPAVTPLGTWSLAIPANVSDRADLAWAVLEQFASAPVQQQLAENGNGGMPRTALLQDAALIERYPTFPLVWELNERDELQSWMRPPVAEWPPLEIIVGTVFHDMLRGQLTPEEATAQVQQEAVTLFTLER
jgi:multiple sugar transport system substrate-binding protein